jgi:hypothetical protein
VKSAKALSFKCIMVVFTLLTLTLLRDFFRNNCRQVFENSFVKWPNPRLDYSVTASLSSITITTRYTLWKNINRFTRTRNCPSIHTWSIVVWLARVLLLLWQLYLFSTRINIFEINSMYNRYTCWFRESITPHGVFCEFCDYSYIIWTIHNPL